MGETRRRVRGSRCPRGPAAERLRRRCGPSDRDRTFPEPGLLVLPARRGQCDGDQRPGGRARARLRSRLLGPPRLEGHVLEARLDGAPVRLRPCDGARRGLYAAGGGQRPGRGRRPRAGRARRAHEPGRPGPGRAGGPFRRPGRSRSGRALRLPAAPRSGSPATIRASSRSPSGAARTPGAPCRTRTSCTR